MLPRRRRGVLIHVKSDQCRTPRIGRMTPVPNYLAQTYWWAYVHPNAVLDAPGPRLDGRTLQIACVYGDLTQRLRERLAPAGSLDVVDVLRVQLANLARKLRGDPRVGLLHGESAALDLPDASYDRALLFFLLHEQPAEVRRRTIAEALRVVKPGGRLVIVDYHRPHRLNPLYAPMALVLRLLEPFALDLWRHELRAWLPQDGGALRKRTLFGGLYQLVTLTVPRGGAL
jgi:ubiquinone/menaquinone biosynthesis C-methylase UbiE